MNTEQWKLVILKMKDWLGEFNFIFSGGEPLLRKDVLDLITFSAKNGLHPSMISNGCGFSSLTEKIVKSGLENLVVSLNGICPSTHDHTRGVPGAWRATVDFIRQINSLRRKLRAQIRVSIATIIMPFNCEEVVEMVKWVRREKLDDISFQPLDRSPFRAFHSNGELSSEGVASGWYQNENNSSNGNSKLNRAVEDLIHLKEEAYPIGNSVKELSRILDFYDNYMQLDRSKCKFKDASFNVDPYGEVRLCFQKEPIGNILLANPEHLYKIGKARNKVTIQECHEPCHLFLR